MNTFLVNFKTFETNFIVFLKFENIPFSLKVDSGKCGCVFMCINYGRFGAKSNFGLLISGLLICNIYLIYQFKYSNNR